jgi:hypothetical protein
LAIALYLLIGAVLSQPSVQSAVPIVARCRVMAGSFKIASTGLLPKAKNRGIKLSPLCFACPMAPTSPQPTSASTLAATTARHALTSERTDLLSHPAFAYPASTSPLPASAPAFEHQLLPLHGLRLPPRSAFAASLLPPVLVPGAFGFTSPAVTFADAASAAETAAALVYIRALP